MNIIKNRYWYFFISLLVIIPGIVFMVLNFKADGAVFLLSPDFTGGSLFELQFSGVRPSVEEILATYEKYSTEAYPINDPIIQPLGEDSYSIRSKQVTEETKARIVETLSTASGGQVNVLNFTSISPSVGQEVTNAAAVAIAMAALAILSYIWYAFRGVEHSFRFGAAAIIAMLHDVLVVIGAEAILGYFLHWEADALFLTALLTVIGFSVHDTIVVFDRVRENSTVYRRVEYETMINHSIVQTLDRSINTQLTVMFTLLSLALFGGESIRHFVIILLVGIFSGTYSSIFNASPILVVWENREWKNWFGRKAETV